MKLKGSLLKGSFGSRKKGGGRVFELDGGVLFLGAEEAFDGSSPFSPFSE